jgi:hypothetical protein
LLDFIFFFIRLIQQPFLWKLIPTLSNSCMRMAHCITRFFICIIWMLLSSATFSLHEIFIFEI